MSIGGAPRLSSPGVQGGFTIPRSSFTLDSRSVIKLDDQSRLPARFTTEEAMEQGQSRIRIELTPEQIKQIKETSGKTVSSLEFSVQELEDRIAPTSFSFGTIKVDYNP
ncbi:MAG: hypothetical protein ACM3SX_08375 [Deltaproteobacteria bacterium]